MRRAILGGLTLALSIAAPLTFHGTAFLAVLWVVIGITGLLAVATSKPVKGWMVAKLREELAIESDSQPASKPSAGDVREAIVLLAAELEEARSVLEVPDHSYFDKRNGLPHWAYSTKATVLARHGDMEAHRAVRAAYQRIDEVNLSSQYIEGPGPPDGAYMEGTIVDEQTAQQALPVIDEALAALHAIKVDHK